MIPFGWSASDLTDAIVIVARVYKVLKDTVGASLRYQQSLEFLKGLESTLQALEDYTRVNPGDVYSLKIEAQVNAISKL